MDLLLNLSLSPDLLSEVSSGFQIGLAALYMCSDGLAP